MAEIESIVPKFDSRQPYELLGGLNIPQMFIQNGLCYDRQGKVMVDRPAGVVITAKKIVINTPLIEKKEEKAKVELPKDAKIVDQGHQDAKKYPPLSGSKGASKIKPTEKKGK